TYQLDLTQSLAMMSSCTTKCASEAIVSSKGHPSSEAGPSSFHSCRQASRHTTSSIKASKAGFDAANEIRFASSQLYIAVPRWAGTLRESARTACSWRRPMWHTTASLETTSFSQMAHHSQGTFSWKTMRRWAHIPGYISFAE